MSRAGGSRSGRLAKLVLHKVAAMLATILVSSFIIYAALDLAPGSPAAVLVGGKPTPQQLEEVNELYNLDDPMLVRYTDWLGNAVQGDFGESYVSRVSAASLVEPRIGTTSLLLILSSILICVGGVTVGLVAGVRGGRVDSLLMSVTTLGLALPAFVVSIVLLTFLAVELGWFPVFGSGEGLPDRIYHLILPAIALSLAGVAYVARISRTAVRAERRRDHVETARGRGLPDRVVVRRHVLRNALIPIVTVSGLTIAGMIAGTVVVEYAFGLNGLGSLLQQSVERKDFPVVQAISLLLVAAFVITNTVVDLLYAALDPRVADRRERS